ncbi:MAG: tyrosine-type recombinase/integrase [Alistipes sp.]|nr:tyrosine-type recombinase/integrase [Alistipes sp.]
MIDRFIAHIESERRYSVLTVRNYRRDLEAFAAWFCRRTATAEFDVASVEAQDISDWIIYRLDTAQLAPATMNREISSLRSFFKYMRRVGVITRDPLLRIGSLKAPKTLPVFVPHTRMEELLESVGEQSHEPDFQQQRDSIIISLLYGCGIRLAELLGIHLADISDGSVKIFGKGGKHRFVPLLPELEQRIERYIALCREQGIRFGDDLLIVGATGRPLSRSTVQRIVARQMSEAGVQGRKSPHVLRHTFATELLGEGADMREIQELMGHSSLSSTQHYTHTDIRQLQGAYGKAHPHK